MPPFPKPVTGRIAVKVINHGPCLTNAPPGATENSDASSRQSSFFSRVIQERDLDKDGVDFNLLEHLSPIGWENISMESMS